jgi:phosphohistidine phosphatase
MLLYIVRHGDADNSMPDATRTLTPKGRDVTRAMAKLLQRSGFVPPQCIVASPLARAQETARIMCEEFAVKAPIENSDALLSGIEIERPLSLIASKKGQYQSLMVVGHDPLFSHLASILVTGVDQPAIEMEKSGVVVIELTRFQVQRMRGVLRAYLPPKIV